MFKVKRSTDLLFIDTPEDPCADFAKCTYKYLSKKDADRLLSTYNIPESSKETSAIWHLCGDYAYNLPVVRAAAAWPCPKQCFMYHFERGHMFRDGPPLQGLVTCLLDVSFHFLNLNHSLSEADQKLATEMAGRWIAFANSEDPWKPHGKERNAMCITDGGEFVV
jgi:carboxylesterase type B